MERRVRKRVVAAVASMSKPTAQIAANAAMPAAKTWFAPMALVNRIVLLQCSLAPLATLSHASMSITTPTIAVNAVSNVPIEMIKHYTYATRIVAIKNAKSYAKTATSTTTDY